MNVDLNKLLGTVMKPEYVVHSAIACFVCTNNSDPFLQPEFMALVTWKGTSISFLTSSIIWKFFCESMTFFSDTVRICLEHMLFISRNYTYDHSLFAHPLQSLYFKTHKTHSFGYLNYKVFVASLAEFWKKVSPRKVFMHN